MTRRPIRYAVVLGLALGLGAACNSKTAPADTTPPAVPTILTPTEGQSFGNYPRIMTMTWNAVDDPSGVTYRVSIQDQLPNGTWEDDTGYGCDGSITGTTCQFNFVGMNPGRIRIQAVDGAGNASDFSAWRNFTYTV